MEERLQKLLAGAGVASRRHCEELIAAGKVTLNGKRAKLGDKADPDRDQILVDGRELARRNDRHYFLLYKPAGYLSTASDPQGRPKVTDLIPLPGVRLYPVGRLDLDTSGLLLLTDDGELANLLTHPRYRIWKCYHALVEGVPAQRSLELLRRGVPLPEGKTAPARVRLLKIIEPNRAMLEISLHQGKKRQVRKMCEFVGHRVLTLKRVKMAFLNLKGLKPGEYRPLSAGEVRRLKDLARGGNKI